MESQLITQLAKDLANIVTRNCASVIFEKIKVAKAKHNDQETINELEEIISNLLTDKAEIQRIAQAYEEELVSQKIKEEDIQYITDNLFPIIQQFIPQKNQEQFQQIKAILSVETLTIMQLIGFNYKQAIGEPLTLLLRKFIESQMPLDPKVNADLTLAMINLAYDKDATDRYCKLVGKNISEE